MISFARAFGQQLQRAFTLIELLVVMAIIMLLSALILAVVGAGGTSSDRQNTKALILTVAAAIDQFANETGAVPLPTGSKSDPQSGSWYPDENDGSWDKQQLWWRLANDMSSADKQAMRDAAEAKSLEVDPYQSDSYMADKYSNKSARRSAVETILDTIPDKEADYYKKTYADDNWAYYGKRADGTDVKPWNDTSQYYGLTYRGKYKSYILAARAAVASDLEKRKFITFACLEMEDLIDSSYLQNQTLVDAWGMPLIYVAHSTVAVKERRAKSGANPMRYMGLKAGGRQTMTDRNNDGLVNLKDWKLKPPSVDDQIDWNKDAKTDVSDWGSILYNAKPGRSQSFYLASAGPDTLFNCLYFEEVNDDNIEMDYKE